MLEKDQMKDFILKRTSYKEEHSLFNLKCQSTEHHQPVHSQLLLIDCKEDKPKKLCCKIISGLTTPDLLLVDVSAWILFNAGLGPTVGFHIIYCYL